MDLLTACIVDAIERFRQACVEPWITTMCVYRILPWIDRTCDPMRPFFILPIGDHVEKMYEREELRCKPIYTGEIKNGVKQWSDIEVTHIFDHEEAKKVIAAHKHAPACMEQFGKVIHGFESEFGLELLESVVWVWWKELAADEDCTIEEVYPLIQKEHKNKFTRTQVILAMRHLHRFGMIDPDKIDETDECQAIRKEMQDISRVLWNFEKRYGVRYDLAEEILGEISSKEDAVVWKTCHEYFQCLGERLKSMRTGSTTPLTTRKAEVEKSFDDAFDTTTLAGTVHAVRGSDWTYTIEDCYGKLHEIHGTSFWSDFPYQTLEVGSQIQIIFSRGKVLAFKPEN